MNRNNLSTQQFDIYFVGQYLKKEEFTKERKVHILKVYCAMYIVQLRVSHNRSY